MASVMHGKPDRGFVRCRPSNTVFPASRDVDKIARSQLHRLSFELKPCHPLEHDHPLVLILVIPKVIRGNLPVRNNPFDTDMRGREQGRQTHQ